VTLLSPPRAAPREARYTSWNGATDRPISVAEGSRLDPGEISILLDFYPTSTEGYPNLFQTADVNEGLRLEITGEPPNASAALVWKRGPGQYGSITMTRNLTINSWHNLSVSAREERGIECSFDGQVFKNDDPVTFRVDSVRLGVGFSAERKFKGSIRNAVVSLGDDSKPTLIAKLFSIVLVALFGVLAFMLRSDFRNRLSKAPPDIDPRDIEPRSNGIWVLWMAGIVCLWLAAATGLFWRSVNVPYPESSGVGFVTANIALSVLFVCAGYEFARTWFFEPEQPGIPMGSLRRYSFVVDLGLGLVAVETAIAVIGAGRAQDSAFIGHEALGLWPLRYLILFLLTAAFAEWAIRLMTGATPAKVALFVVAALFAAKMLLPTVNPHPVSNGDSARFEMSSDLVLIGLCAGAFGQEQAPLEKSNMSPVRKRLAFLVLGLLAVLLAIGTQSVAGQTTAPSQATERLLSIFWGILVAAAVLLLAGSFPHDDPAKKLTKDFQLSQFIIEHRFALFVGILAFASLANTIWTAPGALWLAALETASLISASWFIAITVRHITSRWLIGADNRRHTEARASGRCH
jgi:hypothetical protein